MLTKCYRKDCGADGVGGAGKSCSIRDGEGSPRVKIFLSGLLRISRNRRNEKKWWGRERTWIRKSSLVGKGR